MRRIFFLAQILALAAIVGVAFYVNGSLDAVFKLGRLDHQRAMCRSLADPATNPECSETHFRIRDSSAPSQPAMRFVIYSLLIFIAAMNLFSIFFALKYIRRSTRRHNTVGNAPERVREPREPAAESIKDERSFDF
jgi:hypothetical protein